MFKERLIWRWTYPAPAKPGQRKGSENTNSLLLVPCCPCRKRSLYAWPMRSFRRVGHIVMGGERGEICTVFEHVWDHIWRGWSSIVIKAFLSPGPIEATLHWPSAPISWGELNGAKTQSLSWHSPWRAAEGGGGRRSSRGSTRTRHPPPPLGFLVAVRRFRLSWTASEKKGKQAAVFLNGSAKGADNTPHDRNSRQVSE